MHAAKPKDDVMVFLLKQANKIKVLLNSTENEMKIRRLLEGENTLHTLIGERVLEVENKSKSFSNHCPVCGQIMLYEKKGE